MDDKELTPEQSLSIISKMIENTRQRYSNDGTAFLLWGILIIAGCLLSYTAHYFNFSRYLNFIWLGLIGIGIITTIVSIWKRDKRVGYRNQLDIVGQVLWISFMVAMFIIWFCIGKFMMDPSLFVLVLLGLATTVSGALIQFRPLYAGGIVFWISAIIGSFLPLHYSTLVTAVAMFFGYLVPGWLLRRHVQKVKDV